jgi:hypothetical protein
MFPSNLKCAHAWSPRQYLGLNVSGYKGEMYKMGIGGASSKYYRAELPRRGPLVSNNSHLHTDSRTVHPLLTLTVTMTSDFICYIIY